MATMSFSHPLSIDPPATRRRTLGAAHEQPATSYFTLKHASDERAGRHTPAALVVPTPPERDVHPEQGGYQDITPQTAVPLEAGNSTPIPRTPILSLVDNDDSATHLVLSTRWHTLSDQEIQASIANVSSVQSPSEESKHPYHETIRILSAACERLVKQATALERARKSIQRQEARRKRAAEQAVKELKPGQRDTGRLLLQAIYGLEPAETLHGPSRSPHVSCRSPGLFESLTPF
jgi:hypothetical protein